VNRLYSSEQKIRVVDSVEHLFYVGLNELNITERKGFGTNKLLIHQ